MLGETDPLQSPIGTIRGKLPLLETYFVNLGDFCLQPGQWLHDSDSNSTESESIQKIGIVQSLSPGRNLVHGSDSAEAAEKEIKLWFHRNELMHYDMASRDLIYE